MPYHIVDEHGSCPTDQPYGVVKDSDGHVMGCHPSEEEANKQVEALYANEPMMRDAMSRAPIEFRNAALGEVNYAQRVITVIAAPYETPAQVEYRNELWQEIFERTAWLGIEKRPGRVRANRDHNRSRTVGKAVKFFPSREEGLVAEIRIAQTPLGDETLALADEDCLSTSVGFGCLPKDQRLDRRTMTRRITKAYLDHLAFVESPAYIGADALSVRGESDVWTPPLPRVATPAIDQAIHADIMAWAEERLR